MLACVRKTEMWGTAGVDSLTRGKKDDFLRGQ